MDQQITAVIINRKDNLLRVRHLLVLGSLPQLLRLTYSVRIAKMDSDRYISSLDTKTWGPSSCDVKEHLLVNIVLQKGEGYHLDLLVIAALVLICSFLGLPFYVAATVLSVMHVNSLRLYSESSAPGEIPRFLGVKFVPFIFCLLTVIYNHIIRIVHLENSD